MIEEDKFFDWPRVKFAVLAKLQVDFSFAVGLLAGVDAEDVCRYKYPL
jgi:hypothetical protein